MKAKVDPKTCIGCELCVQTAPEVFEMNGPIAVTKSDTVPPEQQGAAQDAANECPVAAISIE